MIIKGKEGLELSRLRVKYLRDGEAFEQNVGEEGKQWWLDFAAKWEHTEIVEFVDVEYTQEQLERFEEVKDINASEIDLSEYVLNGIIGDGLESFKLQKENEQLRQTLADLTEVVLLGGM